MRKRGQHYETLAREHLEQAGLHCVEQNFRCKTGEIDLICRDGQELVFVEVRYRSHPGYASGAESVTAAKQRKLLRTAQIYLQRIDGVHTVPCRFDVVAFGPGKNADTIQWLRNAFTN